MRRCEESRGGDCQGVAFPAAARKSFPRECLQLRLEGDRVAGAGVVAQGQAESHVSHAITSPSFQNESAGPVMAPS